MYILSNFSSPYCFISFIIGAMFMFVAFCIAAMGKVQEPINNVHFYVVRDRCGTLYLYLGKPERRSYIFSNSRGIYLGFIANEYHFKDFGLNPDDFKDLRWKDEPIEVFLNLED